MHNSLRESFNSNRSKLLLALAIIGLTNSALVENLNAQTPNNGGKAGTEQVDKSDTQRVADFTKPLGVTIPAKWIKFASDNIQMLDQDGIDVAHQLILADLKKIPQEDWLAYILMAFDAIHTAYDKDAHTTAADTYLDQYLNYESMLMTLSKNFGKIRTERTQTYITQTKQEINQNKQKIDQNKQEIIKKGQEAEAGLLKIYNINPNDPKLKTLAMEGKKLFDSQGYKYSEKTAQIFAQLGIK